MENFLPEHEPNPEKMAEYTNDIYALMAETGVPEGAVPAEAVEAGAEILALIYEKYGDPSSENYKFYHNDKHALHGVLRRSWQLLGLHRAQFPDKFTDADYALIMFAALGHDLVYKTGGPMGEDERQSAALTSVYMKRAGFSDEGCARVTEIIGATSVQTENDSIIQTNIRSGEKDVLKLILATADINGIAMEGITTMVNEAFNLCLESKEMTVQDMIENPEIAVAFFMTQARFLEERLAALKGDFAHYYEEKEVEAVDELYEQTFTRATRDALGATQVLYRFPNLAALAITESINAMVGVVGTEIDKLAVAKATLNELLFRLPKTQIV